MRTLKLLALLATVLFCWRENLGQARQVELEPHVIWNVSRSALVAPEPNTAINHYVDARLIITTLGIDAPLEGKGLDQNLKMEDPSNANVVAWYQLQPVLTTAGNASNNIVLAGHHDLKGQAAVFANLNKLRVGDEIALHVNGVTHIYAVAASGVYPLNALNIDALAASTSKETLTLMTCDGYYDPKLGTNTARLVIQANRVL